LLHQNKIRSCP